MFWLRNKKNYFQFCNREACFFSHFYLCFISCKQHTLWILKRIISPISVRRFFEHNPQGMFLLKDRTIKLLFFSRQHLNTSRTHFEVIYITIFYLFPHFSWKFQVYLKSVNFFIGAQLILVPLPLVQPHTG